MVKDASNDGDSPSKFGGHVPGGEGQPAYELIQRRPSALPIMIAVPHAGRVYPADLAEKMRDPANACMRLEDRFVDLVARKVCEQTGASLLVAHAPRAMIDLNRAPEDMDWDMVAGGAPSTSPRFAAGRRARSGLGLVPRRLPGMGEIWKRRMSANDLNDRIQLVHKPYHNCLAQNLEGLRDRWGAALLVDMHSMPPLGAKTGPNPSADFVIGDRYGSSCSSALSMSAFSYFEERKQRAAHNRPYAGGYVLDRHSAPARGLHAMQLEICRATYLQQCLREPGQGVEGIAEILSGLISYLSEVVVSSSRQLPQAAE